MEDSYLLNFSHTAIFIHAAEQSRSTTHCNYQNIVPPRGTLHLNR